METFLKELSGKIKIELSDNQVSNFIKYKNRIINKKRPFLDRKGRIKIRVTTLIPTLKSVGSHYLRYVQSTA